jgi:hypothetical protein
MFCLQMNRTGANDTNGVTKLGRHAAEGFASAASCHAFAMTVRNASVHGTSPAPSAEHPNRPTSLAKLRKARDTPEFFANACQPVRIPLESPGFANDFEYFERVQQNV